MTTVFLLFAFLFFTAADHPGRIAASVMNHIMGDLCFKAHESVFRIAVGKNPVFRAGRDREAHFMAPSEGIGNFCGADNNFINLIRFHKLRFFKPVPESGAENSVGQLSRCPVPIHITNPDHKIRIRDVG